MDWLSLAQRGLLIPVSTSTHPHPILRCVRVQVGLKNGLPISSPVDDAGVFTAEAGPFQGAVQALGSAAGQQSPCCTRVKGPVVQLLLNTTCPSSVVPTGWPSVTANSPWEGLLSVPYLWMSSQGAILYWTQCVRRAGGAGRGHGRGDRRAWGGGRAAARGALRAQVPLRLAHPPAHHLPRHAAGMRAHQCHK